MALKYVPAPLHAVYTQDDSEIVFRVPTQAEILDHAVVGSKRFSHAFSGDVDAKGKVRVDISALTEGDTIDLYERDIRFMSKQLVSIANVIGADGVPLCCSGWTMDEKVRFLLWIFGESEAFQDWMTKFMTTKKKR